MQCRDKLVQIEVLLLNKPRANQVSLNQCWIEALRYEEFSLIQERIDL
jgi:hypothetical protein